MNKKGLTLVEVMISVAIIVLLAFIAIPAVGRMTNESAAKATLRSFSVAAEAYAKSHSGAYPATLQELTTSIASAPDFCADLSGAAVKSVKGYNYKCTSAAGGYTFEVVPITFGITGNVTYTVTTGGALTL